MVQQVPPCEPLPPPRIYCITLSSECTWGYCCQFPRCRMHSKIRWLTAICDSHYVSHFAAFFIEVGAEISIVGSRVWVLGYHSSKSFDPVKWYSQVLFYFDMFLECFYLKLYWIAPSQSRENMLFSSIASSHGTPVICPVALSVCCSDSMLLREKNSPKWVSPHKVWATFAHIIIPIGDEQETFKPSGA